MATPEEPNLPGATQPAHEIPEVQFPAALQLDDLDAPPAQAVNLPPHAEIAEAPVPATPANLPQQLETIETSRSGVAQPATGSDASAGGSSQANAPLVTPVAPPEAAKLPTMTSSEPLKDAELWLEDGNLILVTPTVQFRVYRGPLVAQSLVFKDMLSLPQPVDHRSSVADHCSDCVRCITVPVSDSPEDLRHFLRVFAGMSACFGGLEPSFHELSALIRLGHKYQCDKLLARCQQYLSKFYHDDFDLWRSDEAVFSPPGFEPIHNIGVVNLARLLGADVMLPGALMGCCTLGTEIVHGFAREDGTRETLSLEDLGRCFLGRANLVEANAEATLKLLKQTLAEDCRRPERCELAMRRILGQLTLDNRKVLFNLRWDWSWSPFIDNEDVERDLCWGCYRMLGKQGRQKERHREVFERLPEMMGVKVEGWGKAPAPPPEAGVVDDLPFAHNIAPGP